MTTGDRIRARRKELGISADALAEKIGVSRSTMFRYESGFIEKMPINNLVPIARALSTTVEYLMGWNEDKDIPNFYTEGGVDTESAADISDQALKFALFGDNEGITDAQFEEVKQFAKFVKERDKK